MNKIIISLFSMALLIMPANASSWSASDRVADVGKNIITKNNLPAKTTFKVVNRASNNSNTSQTNVIEISADDLAYTGNDNEVASVICYEIGHIINGKASKDKMRNIAKAVLSENLSADNVLNTTANSEFIANKTSMKDNKEADITGVDLMIQAGYNPLAMIVVLTKKPGSTIEAIMGKPANSERAMNIFDYLTYNYPSKVKAGYGCQEYRAFLTYADPIVQERNSSEKKLEKFNKEQAKNKAQRAKNIAQYKATGGVSGWDASYMILKNLSESSER